MEILGRYTFESQHEAVTIVVVRRDRFFFARIGTGVDAEYIAENGAAFPTEQACQICGVMPEATVEPTYWVVSS